ncbi:hypothetical protein GLOIN_2v1447159, partial [Rhizophagus irregularis DAOM 181602=DAOM 197198]
FLLHAHILSWSGDTPGLTKLMQLTGHNSYKGCRFCDIRGIYLNHVYFPTKPPMEKENEYERYDPENLPLRTHRQFKDRIFQLNQANSKRERKELETEFGIKGRSILFNLKAIHFPNSFPIDLMHLIYENIAYYMFKLWTGTFFNDNSDQNIGDYILSQSEWKIIGEEMHQARKEFPTCFGRPPRNIVLYHKGYKAKEWAAWITMYSLPLLKGRMPQKHYKGWAKFVNAVRLCQKLSLTSQDINDIRFLFQSFYDYYEK